MHQSLHEIHAFGKTIGIVLFLKFPFYIFSWRTYVYLEFYSF